MKQAVKVVSFHLVMVHNQQVFNAHSGKSFRHHAANTANTHHSHMQTGQVVLTLWPPGVNGSFQDVLPLGWGQQLIIVCQADLLTHHPYLVAPVPLKFLAIPFPKTGAPAAISAKRHAQQRQVSGTGWW